MPESTREALYQGVVTAHAERIERAIEIERGCHRLRPIMQAEALDKALADVRATVSVLGVEEQRAILAACYHELHLIAMVFYVEAKFRAFKTAHSE